VAYYFVVNTWDDPPQIYLVKRNSEEAVELAAIDLPHPLRDRFLKGISRSKGVYAINEEIRAWLEEMLNKLGTRPKAQGEKSSLCSCFHQVCAFQMVLPIVLTNILFLHAHSSRAHRVPSKHISIFHLNQNVFLCVPAALKNFFFSRPVVSILAWDSLQGSWGLNSDLGVRAS
jgi:hypothetical protein